MRTCTYGITRADLVKRMLESSQQEPVEFPKSIKKKEDDPDYLRFVREVTDTKSRYLKAIPVRQYKLFGLWWKSKTFQKHWSDRPGKDTQRQLIWNMFCFGLWAGLEQPPPKRKKPWTKKPNEIILLVEAWMRHHGRNPGFNDLAKVSGDIAKVYQEVAPELRKQRERRNQKLREARENPMFEIDKKHTKRGRPVIEDGLRARVKKSLKDGRATPTMIAEMTGTNFNSVVACLCRLVKAGEIVKVGRGLYGLLPDSPQLDAPGEAAVPFLVV